MIDLLSIPPEHPLRNTPLASLRAETRMPPGGWRTIEPNWGIANNTLNELGKIWFDGNSEWRCPQPQTPSTDPNDY